MSVKNFLKEADIMRKNFGCEIETFKNKKRKNSSSWSKEMALSVLSFLPYYTNNTHKDESSKFLDST